MAICTCCGERAECASKSASDGRQSCLRYVTFRDGKKLTWSLQRARTSSISDACQVLGTPTVSQVLHLQGSEYHPNADYGRGRLLYVPASVCSPLQRSSRTGRGTYPVPSDDISNDSSTCPLYDKTCTYSRLTHALCERAHEAHTILDGNIRNIRT